MSATPSMIHTVQSGRNTNVTVASTPTTSLDAKAFGVKEFSQVEGDLHGSYAENCRIFDWPPPLDHPDEQGRRRVQGITSALGCRRAHA